MIAGKKRNKLNCWGIDGVPCPNAAVLTSAQKLRTNNCADCNVQKLQNIKRSRTTESKKVYKDIK